MADEKQGKKRFACFTEEQQADWETLNTNIQRYLVFVSQGYQKKKAYVMAGYKDTKNASKSAFMIEKRYPFTKELIAALAGHFKRDNCYKEGTKESKLIDKKAREPLPEITKVPMEFEGTEQQVDFDKINGEQARAIQFYRRIVDGEIKTVKETVTYDNKGNKTGKKIEYVTDIKTRMEARKELDRRLGLTDMLEVGKVNVGEINIRIVDASDKDALDDPRNKVIVGEVSEETTDGTEGK